jgi:hypothetical protein
MVLALDNKGIRAGALAATDRSEARARGMCLGSDSAMRARSFLRRVVHVAIELLIIQKGLGAGRSIQADGQPDQLLEGSRPAGSPSRAGMNRAAPGKHKARQESWEG